MNIKIGKTVYLTTIANTEESRRKGLLGTKSIKKNMGMLLDFDEPGFHRITMKGMNYPLLLVGISKLNKVSQIIEAEVGKEYIFKKKVKSVLEIHPESNVKENDYVEFVSVLKDGNLIDLHYELDIDGNFCVLDSNGNVQVELTGSERIISRLHTKKLFLLFNEYKNNKTEANLLSIGKLMVNIINTQDTQDTEYV